MSGEGPPRPEPSVGAPPRGADSARLATPLLLAALVAAAMVAFYQAGALLGFRAGAFAWPFWPANGLVFAVLLRRPPREWPLYFAAQVAGELLGGALVAVPLSPATLAYALIDGGESLLAAALLRRAGGASFDLRALRRVGLFLGACLLAVAAAAGAAVLVALLRGSQRGLRFFGTFAVGDLLGFAVVAPAVLRALEARPPGRRRHRARLAEAAALLLLLAGVTLGGFLVPWPAGSYALVHAVIPVLAWCALRLGTAGGSFGILVVAAVGTVLTPRGLGPFALLAPESSAAFAAMQLFLAFVAATALLFAAAVSERRAATAALAQAAAAEAVGTLASTVAHDFGNYLAVIVSGAEVASSELPPGHALQADLGAIRQAGRSAAQLTRRLLDLSRGSAGRVEVVDLGRLVRDAEGMARGLAGPDVSLTVRCAAEPLPVRADRVELERVLLNLVSNARAAARPAGSIAVEVAPATLEESLGAGCRGGGVLLRVRDDGGGMDAATLERIFEPFFTTKQPGRGTGLGLAATRAIVQRARGVVRVASAPGQGTTVSILLPRAGPERSARGR